MDRLERMLVWNCLYFIDNKQHKLRLFSVLVRNFDFHLALLYKYNKIKVDSLLAKQKFDSIPLMYLDYKSRFNPFLCKSFFLKYFIKHKPETNLKSYSNFAKECLKKYVPQRQATLSYHNFMKVQLMW